MDIDIKERLKAQVSIEAVIERLGLIQKLNLRNEGRVLVGNCFNTECKSDSLKCGRFRVHPTDNYAHCFKCGKTFDSIHLVMTEIGS